jgi:hypothetical protein
LYDEDTPSFCKENEERMAGNTPSLDKIFRTNKDKKISIKKQSALHHNNSNNNISYQTNAKSKEATPNRPNPYQKNSPAKPGECVAIKEILTTRNNHPLAPDLFTPTKPQNPDLISQSLMPQSQNN